MRQKNKKVALAMMLSAILATTSCSNDNYQDDAYERIESIMDNSEFYQSNHAYETNEEFYSSFYNHYLNSFIKYMDKDQYDTFVEMVQRIDESERYDFPVIYSSLNSIMGDKGQFGYGFYYAVNTRLIFESLFSAYDLRDDTFTHVNTLRDIINNDEAFYQSLFSKDINKLIDCIMENTYFEDRALVEEMILKFDLYVDKLKSENYMDQKIKEEASYRIQEIMNEIVASKCENDKEFSKTFYARMLKNSRYYGNNEINLTRYLIEDTFDLLLPKYLIITLPNDYYFSNVTLEEVIKEKLLSVIEQEIIDEDNDMLSLLSFIVNENTLDNIFNSDPSKIREYIYNDLSSFFQDENEFNEFCLRLNNGTASSLDEYFKILKARIKEDGITLLDFMRYYSLVELNKENTYSHYEFYEDAPYISDTELRKLKPEEYQDIACNYPENYFLGNISYYDEFASVESILSENDLGFKKIYSFPQRINWNTGSIDYDKMHEILVLSELVEPHVIDYNGSKFVYYECPEGYESGRAVDAFSNIDGELVLRDQPGFLSEINNSDGEVINAYLVGINEDIENYQSLRFLAEYSNILNKEKDEKKLTYEVNHE